MIRDRDDCLNSTTTHILLLRHGQTDANASGTLQGHLPTPLNLTGIRQAYLLAGRLVGFAPPLEILVSSDLARATQTAGPIASSCGLPIVTDPNWRERGLGLLEGKPIGNKEIWQVASGEFDPPGAEPAAQMQERVRSALMNLPITYRNNQSIAVVTHGGPLRAILKMLADGRLPSTRGFSDEIPQIPNCSIMHLLARRYREGTRFRIVAINDVAHLGEMITSRENG